MKQQNNIWFTCMSFQKTQPSPPLGTTPTSRHHFVVQIASSHGLHCLCPWFLQVFSHIPSSFCSQWCFKLHECSIKDLLCVTALGSSRCTRHTIKHFGHALCSAPFKCSFKALCPWLLQVSFWTYHLDYLLVNDSIWNLLQVTLPPAPLGVPIASSDHVHSTGRDRCHCFIAISIHRYCLPIHVSCCTVHLSSPRHIVQMPCLL